MLANYLLLAFRNIARQRGYSFINTLGLAAGLASALFILIYVRDELAFDTMHPKADVTYRLGCIVRYANGDKETSSYVPGGWDNYIQASYPGIEGITSFMSWGMPTSIHFLPKNKIILTEDIIWAEPTITDLIFLPIVKGGANPLKRANTMILTQTAARELFGDEDPIDKTVLLSHAGATQGKGVEMVITGVVKDPPSNSHIRPKYIANILTLRQFTPDLENFLNIATGAENNGFWTESLFICRDDRVIPSIIASLEKQANDRGKSSSAVAKLKPVIRAMPDIHFDQEIDWSYSRKSADKKYIFVFVTIALLILVVAAINYVNLSTARSASRAREIGLRKTFGGTRPQLFAQFMAESLLLVIVAAIVAVTVVFILLPNFNSLTGKTLGIGDLLNRQMMLILMGTILFVTLIGGSYPALFVSGFMPAKVLKGKFAFSRGANVFRKGLTTIQFMVAILLLTGTLIVLRQMDLMRNSTLNRAGKQIVSIRFGGFSVPTTDEHYLSFKHSILSDSRIEAVTLANHLPRLDYFGPINMQFQFPEISPEAFEWSQLNGDHDFPETFRLKIIEGRDFDIKNASDSNAVLLNQSAVESLKITAREAVGKIVVRPNYAGGYVHKDSLRGMVTGTVIGVTEDFPYRSMNKKIGPLAISSRPHPEDRIIHVKLSEGKMSEKIRFLEAKWKAMFPEFGFDHWFVDSEFGRMYENETRIAALVEKFSWLAILITCVGLYGLAAFMAEQRIKEIGIRKSLGASNFQILVLLLSSFGRLLLIASLIAVPMAYFISSEWLERFAYRSSLSVSVFLLSILVIIAITLVAVGYESIKASLYNPVTALKHEA